MKVLARLDFGGNDGRGGKKFRPRRSAVGSVFLFCFFGGGG